MDKIMSYQRWKCWLIECYLVIFVYFRLLVHDLDVQGGGPDCAADHLLFPTVNNGDIR